MAQIQRDLDRAKDQQKDLQARLDQTQSSTEAELKAARDEYERAQQTALDRQKRELLEKYQKKSWMPEARQSRQRWQPTSRH